MQTKDSRRLELKYFSIFFALFLLFPFSAWATQQKVPQKGEKGKEAVGQKTKKDKDTETPGQREKIDKALASQKRGGPMQGKAIRKPLGVTSKKSLLKKLETHPPKQLRHKPVGKKEETIRQPLIPHPKPSLTTKPFKGDRKIGERKSRFKPDLVKKPLKTGK